MRTTLLISALFLACTLGGCGDPTATFDGKKLTSAQIEAAVDAKVKEAAIAAEAAAKKAAADVAAAKQAAQDASDKLARDYALKLKRLAANASIDADKTTNELADLTGEVNRGLADKLAGIVTQQDAYQATLKHSVDEAKAMADAAQADIQRQIEQRGWLLQVAQGVTQLPVVKQAVDASGGGGLLAGLFGMAGTAVAGYAARASGSKARHDATWDEAYKAGQDAAKAQADAANAAWDQAHADALKNVVLSRGLAAAPAPAAAVTP